MLRYFVIIFMFQDQNKFGPSKTIWTVQDNFGPIEGQGILLPRFEITRLRAIFLVSVWPNILQDSRDHSYIFPWLLFLFYLTFKIDSEYLHWEQTIFWPTSPKLLFDRPGTLIQPLLTTYYIVEAHDDPCKYQYLSSKILNRFTLTISSKYLSHLITFSCLEV